MKIIKRGTTEKIAKIIGYEIQCAKCESIFQCKHNEVHPETIGHGMVGDSINCPVCGNHINELYSMGAKYWKILYTEGRRPYADEVEYV